MVDTSLAQTIYVSVNDEQPSKMLVAEITRSLYERVNHQVKTDGVQQKQLAMLEEVRLSLVDKVVFVGELDLEAQKEHGVPYGVPALHYRVGRYETWKPIDKRAFTSHAFPLLHINYIVNRDKFEKRIETWKKNCQDLYAVEFYAWTKDLEDYIYDNFSNIISYDEIYCMLSGGWYKETDTLLEDIQETMDLEDEEIAKFPEFKHPTYPAPPNFLVPPYVNEYEQKPFVSRFSSGKDK